MIDHFKALRLDTRWDDEYTYLPEPGYALYRDGDKVMVFNEYDTEAVRKRTLVRMTVSVSLHLSLPLHDGTLLLVSQYWEGQWAKYDEASAREQLTRLQEKQQENEAQTNKFLQRAEEKAKRMTEKAQKDAAKIISDAEKHKEEQYNKSKAEADKILAKAKLDAKNDYDNKMAIANAKYEEAMERAKLEAAKSCVETVEEARAIAAKIMDDAKQAEQAMIQEAKENGKKLVDAAKADVENIKQQQQEEERKKQRDQEEEDRRKKKEAAKKEEEAVTRVKANLKSIFKIQISETLEATHRRAKKASIDTSPAIKCLKPMMLALLASLTSEEETVSDINITTGVQVSPFSPTIAACNTVPYQAIFLPALVFFRPIASSAPPTTG
jgi:hypothetical protein